jgi:ferrochelatase
VETLENLPQQGIKDIDVVCPGFAVDCLETLEEIAMTNQEIFIAAGGESYRYIPALNDSEAQVALLAALIKA